MQSSRIAYPVDLLADEDGRVVARIRDILGCVTDGATREMALREAADALEEALARLMEAREDIPRPSAARGRPLVTPGGVISAKLALYRAMRESRTSNVSLAKRLGVAETEIRRMLDPRHQTKLGRLEAALAALGRRLVVTVEAA
jgi:antitoxin HicB